MTDKSVEFDETLNQFAQDNSNNTNTFMTRSVKKADSLRKERSLNHGKKKNNKIAVQVMRLGESTDESVVNTSRSGAASGEGPTLK